MIKLIGLVLCLVYFVNSETFPECKGKPDHAYITNYKKQDNCRSFIYCNGENSFADSCPEGLAFNSEDMTCDFVQNVECLNPDKKDEDDHDVDASYIDELENFSTTEVEMTSSKRPIITGTPKHHPTPPGRPSKTSSTIQSTKSTPRKNSNRPVPTRTQSPTKIPTQSPPTKRPISKSTTTPTSTTKTPPKATTPINIPTPPAGPHSPDEVPMPFFTKTTTKPTEEPDDRQTPKITKLPPTHSTVVSVTTEIVENSTKFVDASALAAIKEECSKKFGGSFPYPGDCHYYYRCMRGNLSKEECPKGFGWDSEAKMCTAKGCLK